MNEGLVEKLNKVDEFTRLRAPDAAASATENAATLATLTPQNLIDRRLYATKLAALNQLESYLKEVSSLHYIAKDSYSSHCVCRLKAKIIIWLLSSAIVKTLLLNDLIVSNHRNSYWIW